MFGNAKPLAKIVFFLEYTRGLLCWYVRDTVKAVVLNSHSGQKCIHTETGTTTDAIRDPVSQCFCCCFIASGFGSQTRVCYENKRIGKCCCRVGIPYCSILPCIRLFWLRGNCEYSFFLFLFLNNFFNNKRKVMCRFLSWKQTTNKFFPLS